MYFVSSISLIKHVYNLNVWSEEHIPITLPEGWNLTDNIPDLHFVRGRDVQLLVYSEWNTINTLLHVVPTTNLFPFGLQSQQDKASLLSIEHNYFIQISCYKVTSFRVIYPNYSIPISTYTQYVSLRGPFNRWYFLAMLIKNKLLNPSS